MNPHPPPAIAEVFAQVLEGLRRAIAAKSAKTPLMVPIFVLLWNRLGGVARRFEALVVRFEAGKLPPPRGPRPVRVRPPPDPAATPPARLPRGYRWVIAAVPGSINFAGQLRHVLSQPDMAALLATPQAGRLLRPLLHSLGIEPGPDLPATLFRQPNAAKPKSAPAGTPSHTEHAPSAGPSHDADGVRLAAWRRAARVARRLGRGPARTKERAGILPGYFLKPA